MGNPLQGLCIFPNANDIHSFSFQDYHPQEWKPWKLFNGKLLDFSGPALKRLTVDFDGGDYWKGYILGFIYADGKFIGKAHYLPEFNAEPEPLNGKYELLHGGIEFKGIWEATHEGRYGFFIRLSENEGGLQKASRLITSNPKNARSASDGKNNTFAQILDKKLFDTITKKGIAIKKKNKSKAYNHYQHVIGLKIKPTSLNDVILAMSVAYSWMPTMLDIYISPGKRHENRLLNAVTGLGKIKTLNDFQKQEKNIERWLFELVEIVNHSIVGVSKTLHIFYPDVIPIIDSRVLKGWDKTFKRQYKKEPLLKLPKHIPVNSNRMVKAYMRYWKTLLCWSNNIGNKSIRKLEEPFYLMGK